MSKIVAIVAVARNLAIGRDGKLPWHYPADLRFFKERTTGNAIVMGRTTWESIGRPLPKRLNVVVSRTMTPVDGALVAGSIADVLKMKGFLACDVCVIGGARTYSEFAAHVDEWIVTEIPETVADADVFMPPDFLEGFEERETIELGDDLRAKVFVRKEKAG